MKTIALLASDSTVPQRLPTEWTPAFERTHDSPVLNLEILIDPLSKAAQRLASMLQIIQKYFPVNVKVILNVGELQVPSNMRLF